MITGLIEFKSRTYTCEERSGDVQKDGTKHRVVEVEV
jgi:hypothetical protein